MEEADGCPIDDIADKAGLNRRSVMLCINLNIYGENLMDEKKLTGYPSVDKPWLKYYSEETKKMQPDKCTLFRSIFKRNSNYMKDTAIQYYGNNISYNHMFCMVEKTAKALKKAGVKKGNYIALCTSGVPEAIYLVLACSKIGAVANFLNPLFSKEQMRARINDTNAQYLFVMDEMISYIEDVVGQTCISTIVVLPIKESMKRAYKIVMGMTQKKKRYTLGHKLYTWERFIHTGENYKGETEIEYERNLPVIMVYSSGTTGASKGIVLTNDGVNATITHYLSPDFPFERGYTFLQMIPIWFSTGIVLSILMPICIGATVIPELLFSKENFVKNIKKHRPEMTLTATSLWLYAVSSNKLKNTDLSNMKYPITGGEPVKLQDETDINCFLAEHGCTSTLLKGYGMCELGSTVTADSKAHSKKGSSGFPILGVVVAAFDMETDEEQPFGKRGEIRVCSPARMKEYYKNPTATQKYFYMDKKERIWGCTGDIGYVDEEGDVFILRRSNDSFLREDGKTAYLFDSEAVILGDEAVSQCKTIAIHKAGKEIPYAHVVLNKSKGVTESEVIKRIDEACKRYLPKEEIPMGYKIRTEMPVHANGKRNIEALMTEKDGYVFCSE